VSKVSSTLSTQSHHFFLGTEGTFLNIKKIKIIHNIYTAQISYYKSLKIAQNAPHKIDAEV
jgi:hypothetical protein